MVHTTFSFRLWFSFLSSSLSASFTAKIRTVNDITGLLSYFNVKREQMKLPQAIYEYEELELGKKWLTRTSDSNGL